MSVPVWTPYAEELALRYVLNLSPDPSPTGLYLALFSDTADPSTGHEVIDATYARLALTFNTGGSTTFVCETAGSFNMTSAGSFLGLRVMDTPSGSGNTFFWQDLDTVYEYDAGSSIPLLASNIFVALFNPSEVL